MKHVHLYIWRRKNSKVEVCACGRFRHRNLKASDIIAGVPATKKPGHTHSHGGTEYDFARTGANAIPNSLYRDAVLGLITRAERNVKEATKVREINAELLAALKAQHEALDTLLAMLIARSRYFMPSKSSVWPAVLQGKAAIAKAENTTKEAR